MHRLHLAATDGAHVRLAGPRRYGKTSLLLAHAANLDATGWHTVHVDFYGVTWLLEVCARIATAYGRVRDRQISTHVESLGARLGLSLTTSGIGVTLSPREAQPSHDSLLTAAGELLDLPLKTAEAHQAVWDVLSAGKKAALASLADGLQPTGSRATERSGLARATLQSALRDLDRDRAAPAPRPTRPTPPVRGASSTPLFAGWVARPGHARGVSGR